MRIQRLLTCPVIFMMCCLSGSGNLCGTDVSAPPSTAEYKIIPSLNLWEGDEHWDRDYSNCRFEYINIDTLTDVRRCSFANAVFCDGGFALATMPGDECDFTDAEFSPKMWVFSCGEYLMQTKNFKSKKLGLRFMHGDFPNYDFSDFEITSSFTSNNLEGANFENTYFKSVRIGVNFSQEQFKQTRNYKTGLFYGVFFANLPAHPISLTDVFQNLDISRMSFVEFKLDGSMRNANISDSVFTDCDLSKATDLTLEQIKSTWNYKNGRMSLMKLPPELQAALDAEEAEKNAVLEAEK